MILLKIACINRTYLKFNNVNNLVWYDTISKHNAINYFAIVQAVIALYTMG